MTRIPNSALRRGWQHTFADVANDYTGREDGGTGFRRIYRNPGAPHRPDWFWTCARCVQIASGYAATAREAALAAETAYWAADDTAGRSATLSAASRPSAEFPSADTAVIAKPIGE